MIISLLKLPFFLFYFIPHRFPNVDISKSPYYNKKGPSKSYAQTGMWPTIDDPAMIEMAEIIKHRTRYMSDLSKASYILSLVQQSVKYVSDSKNHHVSEYWELPINTYCTRQGDCEDSAFLCACLMHLCGLDCILIHMDGHMTVGCTAKPIITALKPTYIHDGKTYYRAETTTAVLPYSYNTKDTKIRGYYDPIVPSDSFKRGVH